ncbi:MAG: hypothetical protein LBB68_03140 [Treponema sp.]|jgi:hypothetical protein|nr:hypothetical protein [Treponema sp.]
MRFFLCAFGAFSLGVPVYAVSSLITVPWEVEQMIDRDRDENTYFSIPHFFRSRDHQSWHQEIRHGLILKPLVQEVPLIGGGNGDNFGLSIEAVMEKNGFADRRNVLLVTTVEKEMDFPRAEIQPLPSVLSLGNRVSFFSGVNFSGPLMNIFLDPAVLVQRMLSAEKG